jgi:hypothetical protein
MQEGDASFKLLISKVTRNWLELLHKTLGSLSKERELIYEVLICEDSDLYDKIAPN